MSFFIDFMVERLLPYVEDRTLDDVIGRLQHREKEYLRHITQKVIRENPTLLPFGPGVNKIAPVGFGVYELLSLSLSKGKKMPVVEKETIDRGLDGIIVQSPDEETVSTGMFFDFRDNENIPRFIEWLKNKGRCLTHEIMPGFIVYGLIEKQAEIDEARRRASLN